MIITGRFISRSDRQKKGYRQNSLVSDLSNTAVVALLITVYTWQLGHHRGISVMALWVIAVTAVYNFITSRMSAGRYFYAVGGKIVNKYNFQYMVKGAVLLVAVVFDVVTNRKAGKAA